MVVVYLVFKESIMEFVGKVLIIVQNLPVPLDRRVWLESMALRDAGYQVSIIAPTGKKGKYQAKYEYIDNIHVYRYPAPPEAQRVWGYVIEFGYCWIMTALLSLWIALRHGFDILHACNPPETYFVLGFFYQLFGKKFIFDHHDLSPEMYLAKEGKPAGLLYKILLLLEKLTFGVADVVITTNQSHRRIAMHRGNVPEENIFIVRSGPDFQRLQLLSPEPALKDGFPYLICYLGEMCTQDGVDYLLKAAKALIVNHNRHDIKFVLMGGGPDFNRLVQMKSEMGLDGYVDFTGRVSDQDLCRYLSTADICIDPDPYTEWSNQSTMNKIMEYMAFAKPVVAFDLRENRYSAQEAALYATPNNIDEMVALTIQLIDNETLRQEMGTVGFSRARTFLNWENSVPHLLEAYTKVTEPSQVVLPTFSTKRSGGQQAKASTNGQKL